MEKNIKKYLILINLFLVFICLKLLLHFKESFKYWNKFYLFDSFISYLQLCKNHSKINYKSEKLKDPINETFISVCVPSFNTEKYIKKSIYSIINQSFHNFEVIIVNDCSTDSTFNILKELQDSDIRIKIINNKSNFGVYHSRIEAVLYSRGQYILFFDPDDIIFNRNLYLNLYTFNLKKNFDIIEFLAVYHPENVQLDINNFFQFRHNHHYRHKIIYQPELKNIIHYNHEEKIISKMICNTIWNKLYKRNLQLKTIRYIGNLYYNSYLMFNDDAIINYINFNFAINYTNIGIPAYLYIMKNKSMSMGFSGINHRIKQNINVLFFLKILYKIIKQQNKNRDYFLLELERFKDRIVEFKIMNIRNYLRPMFFLLS